LLHHIHAASLSAGAPQLESALRALRARCERALYQQLLAWTVHGLLVDPHGEFFVRPVRGAGGDGGVWLGGDDRGVELDPRDGNFGSGSSTLYAHGDDDGDGGESEWHRGFQVSLEALPPGVELPAAEATLFVGRAVRVLSRPRGAFRGQTLLPESTSAEATAALRRLARSDGEFHRAAFDAAVEGIRRPVAARLGRLVVTDARLLAHLEALRNYHLLGRGDFFQAFFDEAANLFSAPPRPATAEADMIAPFAQAALKSSARDDPLVANFRLRFRPEGDAREPKTEPPEGSDYASSSPVDGYRVPSFDGWDALELEYRVPWPLGLLLTRDALRRYNALHRYLFRLRRTALALDDAWFRLRRKAAGASTTTPGALRAGEQRVARERRRNGDDAAFEACQRARRDVSFLVNNWLTYLQVDVVEAQYREMIARVERAAREDFAEAQRAHRSFLAAVAAQSFLDLASVTDVVEAIMRLAANLCAVVASLPADGSSPSEDAAAEAEAIGAAFARQSAALYRLLRSNRLADDPKAPYLRQLLLRLNYNDFFFAAARKEGARNGENGENGDGDGDGDARGRGRGDGRARDASAAGDGFFFSNASSIAAPSTVGGGSVPASLAASGASSASARRGGWGVPASDVGPPPPLSFRRA
jgi:gamma-tubulin complex component 4